MSQRLSAADPHVLGLGRARRSSGADMRPLTLALLLVGGGLFAGACGTTPETALQAKPIAAISEVAGRWTGLLHDPRGGQVLALNINADGTWEQMSASAPPVRLTGTLQLVSGQLWLRPQATGRLATATLYEGQGRRVLILRSDDGRVTQYTAAGP